MEFVVSRTYYLARSKHSKKYVMIYPCKADRYWEGTEWVDTAEEAFEFNDLPYLAWRVRYLAGVEAVEMFEVMTTNVEAIRVIGELPEPDRKGE